MRLRDCSQPAGRPVHRKRLRSFCSSSLWTCQLISLLAFLLAGWPAASSAFARTLRVPIAPNWPSSVEISFSFPRISPPPPPPPPGSKAAHSRPARCRSGLATGAAPTRRGHLFASKLQHLVLVASCKLAQPKQFNWRTGRAVFCCAQCAAHSLRRTVCGMQCAARRLPKAHRLTLAD